MVNDTTVRENVILSFDTNLQATRRLSVPNPNPELTSGEVASAAANIIGADIYDEMHGRPVALQGAVHERIETTKLF